MSNLVYQDDQRQVVTDSTILAQAFDKNHNKVLRDIRSLTCSDDFKLKNIADSSYLNKQGRKMPMYILTYEGFVMVGMGYTGNKAAEFKERFINDFKRTVQNLDSQIQTEISHQDMAFTGQLLAEYDSFITLRFEQQNEIQELIRKRIYDLYPVVKKNGRMKYFSTLYQELKKEFAVKSFRDIKLSDLDRAKEFIAQWGVSTFGQCSKGGELVE